jgi:hypothetical protein
LRPRTQRDKAFAENGKLTALLIDAPSLPGWESFGALIEHMKFVVIIIAKSIV